MIVSYCDPAVLIKFPREFSVVHWTSKTEHCKRRLNQKDNDNLLYDETVDKTDIIQTV